MDLNIPSSNNANEPESDYEIEEDETIPETRQKRLKRSRLEDTNDDSMKELIKKLMSQSNRIEKKLETLDDIKQIINQQNTKIQTISKDMAVAQNRIQDLEAENERLEKELKKSNLILTGITDDVNESEQTCLDKTKSFLTTTMKIKGLTFDTAHRLGKFQNGKDRPIKLRVMKHSDREKILSQKSNLPESVFISEDLPKQTRKNHFVLRQAAREAQRQNQPYEIKWNQNKITIAGKTSIIKNGALERTEEGEPSFLGTGSTKRTTKK